MFLSLAPATRRSPEHDTGTSLKSIAWRRINEPIDMNLESPSQSEGCVETQINMKKVYTVSDDTVESRLGDETVLLHLESGVYFGLDAVGTDVWELLQEGASVDAICDTLRQEYADAGESLEADILRFLGHLIDNKLIRET